MNTNNKTQQHDSLTSFMNITNDGYFHIGHASGLLRINGKLILFDPCWNYKPFSEYWSLVPEQFDCDRVLSKIDACIVSHIHDDHYSQSIISRLNCPITIMSGRPDLSEKLKSFGANVREFSFLDSLELLDGIFIRFFPSSFNSEDSSSLVWTPAYCFYHGNDNTPDLYELKRFITENHMDVDLACVPYAYLNWYPECLMNLSKEEKQAETLRLINKLCNYAVDLIHALDPVNVIPCAANLFYNDEPDSNFNKMGISPWEFKRRAQDRMPFNTICALGAGDMVIENQEVSKWTEESYNKAINDNISKNKPKELTADLKFNITHLDRLINKVNKATRKVDNHIVLFRWGTGGVLIDLGKKTVEYREDPFDDDRPLHIIEIASYQLMQWLNGQITFEMVVATRKFKMYRYPNVYNVDVLQFLLNEL